MFGDTASGKQTLINSHGSGRSRNWIPLSSFHSRFPHNNNYIFIVPLIKRSHPAPLKYYEQVTTTGTKSLRYINLQSKQIWGIQYRCLIFFVCCLPFFFNIFSWLHWKFMQKGYLNHISFVWTKCLHFIIPNLIWHKTQYQQWKQIWHVINYKPKRLRLVRSMSLLDDSASARKWGLISDGHFYMQQKPLCSTYGFRKNLASVVLPRPSTYLHIMQMALVRERTIPNERQPLLGEVSAIFCGLRCRVVSATDSHGR
jgi:hypothetical protein